MSILINSIKNYFSAFKMLLKYRLWKYIFVSGLFSFLLGVILIYFSFGYASRVSDYIFGMLPSFLAFPSLETVMLWIIKITVFIPLILFYKYVFVLLFGGYMGKVSLEVERRMLGEFNLRSNNQIRVFLGDIGYTIRLIRKELFWMFFAFILTFIPIVNITVPILLIIIQAYFAGANNIGIYLFARNNTKKEVVHYQKRHRGLALANGFVFVLLLMIPLFGLIFAPMISIIALTRERVRLNEN